MTEAMIHPCVHELPIVPPCIICLTLPAYFGEAQRDDCVKQLRKLLDKNGYNHDLVVLTEGQTLSVVSEEAMNMAGWYRWPGERP